MDFTKPRKEIMSNLERLRMSMGGNSAEPATENDPPSPSSVGRHSDNDQQTEDEKMEEAAAKQSSEKTKHRSNKPKQVAKRHKDLAKDSRSNFHMLDFKKAHKYMFTRPGFNQLRDEVKFQSADLQSRNMMMCIYQTAVKRLTQHAIIITDHKKAKTIEPEAVKIAAEILLSKKTNVV